MFMTRSKNQNRNLLDLQNNRNEESNPFLDSLTQDAFGANTPDRFELIDFELVHGLGCVCHTSVSPTTSANHPAHANFSSNKQLYETLE